MARRSLPALALLACTSYTNGLSLQVSTNGGNASSPLLWGAMFEDINNSGDGALHGQLLMNNGFQGVDPGLDPWTSVGRATVFQDTNTPLTNAIGSTLRIQANDGATGTIGASNGGYSGLRVTADTYSSYFWVKGSYSGNATVALVASDGSTLASTGVQLKSNSSAFSYYETKLTAANAAADGGNTWQFTFDAATAADGGLNLGLPQLFPTTFKNRRNGLNAEVANTVNAVGASFLRFPGGNNLEGNSTADRWLWNATVGPVEDRPGRQGDWGYPNTDALGLLEYMYWTQDMGLEPLLALWDGAALDLSVITGDALQPYVQEVMDELEYLMGDASTPNGAKRAADGQQDPFEIRYVEIGNEDYLSGDPNTYQERFMAYYNAISAAHPNITFVASTGPKSIESYGALDPLPDRTWQDVHQYLQPDEYVQAFSQFDNLDRSQPLIVGEFGSTQGNDGSETSWEYMQASCSEAVYMIGIERNSDLVRMASYAPLLEHFDRAEWSPDLFGYDAPNGVARSTSYFAFQMFASNRGDTIVPVTADGPFGPVYWVASTAGSTVFVKMANYGTEQQQVTIAMPKKTSASFTLLTADAGGTNRPGQETVKPTTQTVTADGGSFTVTLGSWAVAVLKAT